MSCQLCVKINQAHQTVSNSFISGVIFISSGEACKRFVEPSSIACHLLSMSAHWLRSCASHAKYIRAHSLLFFPVGSIFLKCYNFFVFESCELRFTEINHEGWNVHFRGDSSFPDTGKGTPSSVLVPKHWRKWIVFSRIWVPERDWTHFGEDINDLLLPVIRYRIWGALPGILFFGLDFFKTNFLHEKNIIFTSGFFLYQSTIYPRIQKSYL